MHIRKYKPGEEQELWNLFYNTVRAVNLADYTQQQVEAWAPDDADMSKWHKRIEGINPYVCIEDDAIIGYTDLQPEGYIDHFYVHHQRQRRGVGKLLYETVETEALRKQIAQLTSEVSITARPFFESCGFEVVEPQEVYIGDIAFRNFKMRKSL
ncbi:MAG: GNAT family N-acetyltransferase [Planctomycetaceae bacterium]|nr:GNAT family N-acetyltransferase [Planctomycetaceae bacterium]